MSRTYFKISKSPNKIHQTSQKQGCTINMQRLNYSTSIKKDFFLQGQSSLSQLICIEHRPSLKTIKNERVRTNFQKYFSIRK